MNKPQRLLFLLLAAATMSYSQAGTGMSNDETAIAQQLDVGVQLLDQGIPDTAITKYFDAVIHHYEKIYGHAGKGVYFAHDANESAIYAAMDRAKVVTDSIWPDALELKGYALVEMQREDEAIKVLKQAIELAPIYPASWSELGNIYQGRKQWSEAADAYHHAAEGAGWLEDSDAKRSMQGRAWRGEGYVLLETGKLDEAEVLYRKCLTLDPADSRAKAQLAYISAVRNAQTQQANLLR